MADIIHLLPDAIANQIAAGEVVQRPASVVKELLENAVDAGATSVQLYFKDGGTNFIQVLDNGKGMSETDARMCWERHATSKIRNADDLFKLKTFGFRGEALASIAAVAQVEMKTRQNHHEIGTRILIEGSTFKSVEAVQAQAGTSISVRNLFFNVPARRNFLKSSAIETRHILDECNRVALSHPELHLTVYHGDKLIYDLPAADLKTRTQQVLGLSDEQELIPVDEHTDIIRISGFIGSPFDARKTRGEQYFIANGRFIRDSYLHHALATAYQGLIDDDRHPMYLLHLQVASEKIDVNVHPTKTEVKFEDSKAIYAILHSVVRKAISGFNQSPEWEEQLAFNPLAPMGAEPRGNDGIRPPATSINRDYNPFGPSSGKKRELTQWEKLYEPFRDQPAPQHHPQKIVPLFDQEEQPFRLSLFGLKPGWIICNLREELLIIDQQAAHERVLFERYMTGFSTHSAGSQQLLFPRTVQFSPSDAALLGTLLEEIAQLGFDISYFGKDTFVVNGLPIDIQKADVSEMLFGLLATYRENEQELRLGKRESLARSMARQASIRSSQLLSEQECESLVRDLLKCEEPAFTPSGRAVWMRFSDQKLKELFKKS